MDFFVNFTKKNNILEHCGIDSWDQKHWEDLILKVKTFLV